MMNKSVLIVLAAMLGVALGIDRLYNNPDCGKRPFKPSVRKPDPLSKVVGGIESVVGDHGWQIALLRNGNFICGGSLLNENTVLCAAHCTTVVNPGIYTIVRTHSRNPYDSWAQTRSVVRLVNHPGYNSRTYENDISLLFVSQPFDITPNQVNTVCLPDVDPKVNQTAVASGWGSTASGGSVVVRLREAEMPITQESSIRVQYGNSYIASVMIGAAYQGDGLDTCQGDSGGPLSVDIDLDNDGTVDIAQVVGIVSWGIGCGGIGIYTRVTAYVEWIKAQVGLYYKENNIKYLP